MYFDILTIFALLFHACSFIASYPSHFFNNMIKIYNIQNIKGATKPLF